MGLTSHDTAFLFGCKASGVDFSSLCTLGRQEFFPCKKVLRRIFSLHAIDKNIDALIVESRGYGEGIFRILGAREINSVDTSGYEGATIIHDMNNPIDKQHCGRFSIVFDGGTLGHVFNLAQAFRNCMEMVRPGGHFLMSAEANNFMGHGFYQFSPELVYRVLNEENGFKMKAVLLFQSGKNARWWKAKDPKECGKRIELESGTPLYLLACAQKIEDRKIFAPWPQQSDYMREWANDGSNQPAKANKHQFLKRIAPAFLKNAVRPYVRKYIRSNLGTRKDAFSALRESDVIMGNWDKPRG